MKRLAVRARMWSRVKGRQSVDHVLCRRSVFWGQVREYPCGMKKLILLGVAALIAAVIYKVLTTEVPIKE